MPWERAMAHSVPKGRQIKKALTNTIVRSFSDHLQSVFSVPGR